MTTFSLESSHWVADDDPCSITFTPAAAGNLLVAIISERSGTTADDNYMWDSGLDGWTTAFYHDQELADINARHSLSVHWKIVDATEVTSLDFIADNGTANGKSLSILEVTPSAAYDFSFVEAASDDSGTADIAGQSSGDTSSISGSDLFVLDVAGIRCATNTGQLPTFAHVNRTTGATENAGIRNKRAHGYGFSGTG